MNTNLPPIGSTVWVVADGYIPPESTGPEPDMTSHDSICMLNAGDSPTSIEAYVYFTDREPTDPYPIHIEARRAYHQRINDIHGPASVPTGVDHSLVINSDVPIIVQHTRLDSRQAANALMSTIAYSAR